MVSKILKRRTPTRTLKDRRLHPRKRSPSYSSSSSSSKLLTSINKTIHSCKRRIAKIFSKLARIATPKANAPLKGYKALKRLQFDLKCEELEDQFLERESICRVLFHKDKLLPPLISHKKGTVFLDLDETLVHSTADPPPEKYDFIVRPKIDGAYMNFYVLKRPGLDEFLEALGRKFEVVVFTAGLKEYASLVVDRIDVKGLVSYRLYRDSCKKVDGKFVKDLSELGRDLKRVVIVDDNPNCYCFQPENAIPVSPFVDDLGDWELRKLVRFFDGCDFFEDMRDAVKHFVSGSDWEDLGLQIDVLFDFNVFFLVFDIVFVFFMTLYFHSFKLYLICGSPVVLVREQYKVKEGPYISFLSAAVMKALDAYSVMMFILTVANHYLLEVQMMTRQSRSFDTCNSTLYK